MTAEQSRADLLARLSELLGVEVIEVFKDTRLGANAFIDLHSRVNPYSGDVDPAVPLHRTHFVIGAPHAVVRVTSGQIRNPRTFQQAALRLGRSPTRPPLNAGDGHAAGSEAGFVPGAVFTPGFGVMAGTPARGLAGGADAIGALATLVGAGSRAT